MAEVTCSHANLTNSTEAADVIRLLNTYATDIMGGSTPLSDFAQHNLIAELAKRPTAHCFLAYIGGEAVGVSISFEGFSTFECKPLLNIHDFAVSPDHRRKGVGKALMNHIIGFAQSIGCCKLTLEVLEGNSGAQQLYRLCGFEGYELGGDTGKGLVWQKKL